MKNLLIIPLSCSLIGCVTTQTVGSWNKAGLTQQQFSIDRFECMRVSQEQYSDSYVNQYGGSGYSAQRTNINLFSACMNARGYYWATKQIEVKY